MTEQEFDRKVEELAGRFERRVEASADRLEQGLTQRWNGSRWFRLTAAIMPLLSLVLIPPSGFRISSGSILQMYGISGSIVLTGTLKLRRRKPGKILPYI